jgi:hypothetical protein
VHHDLAEDHAGQGGGRDRTAAPVDGEVGGPVDPGIDEVLDRILREAGQLAGVGLADVGHPPFDLGREVGHPGE